jgi:hypothetical protein
METSERQTNFLKRGEQQLSFSNILPTDTEDSRQDDGVHESSDDEMNPIERETFQKHVETNQIVEDDGLIFQPRPREDDTNSMSEDETTGNSSPYFRRAACPSMPTLNHSGSRTPPEDSEGGLVKRMLRRSLAWSQDSADAERTKSWKRRKDDPSSEEFATALWHHLPASSHGDTSPPTCVHWEEKLTDLFGLTSGAQQSNED